MARMSSGVIGRAATLTGKIWRARLVLPLALLIAGGVPAALGLGGSPLLDRWLAAQFIGVTLDALNSFVPLWIGLLVTGLLLLPRARPGPGRRRAALASGLALLVAGYPVAIELMARARILSPPGAGPRLRVLQFNAFDGNHDLPAAIAMIRRTNADVVAIEEPMKLRQVMPELLRSHPFTTPCQGKCDVLLLSRQRPIRAWVDSRVGSWYPIATPGNGPLELARMDLAGTDGRPIQVVAVHLFWPLPPAPAQHQRDLLANYLTGLDRSRAVLMGDFNLTPWSFAMRGLDGGLQPMRRVTRALFSWPAYYWNSPWTWPLPVLPIDQVYAGSNWRVTDIERLPRAGSDHFPVLVDLRRGG